MQLKISVIDTGIGIRKEDLADMFQDFSRFDLSTNRNIEGTGLGLALAKKVVLLHQGTIQVSSKVGEGTEFTVALPRCDDMRK